MFYPLLTIHNRFNASVWDSYHTKLRAVALEARERLAQQLLDQSVPPDFEGALLDLDVDTTAATQLHL